MVRELGLALLLTTALAAGPAAAVAGQSATRVAIAGGGLSVQAPAGMELPPVRLRGSAVTVAAPVGEIRVVDTRSGAPGWTLVASAAAPVDARGEPMEARLVVVPEAREMPTGVRLGEAAALDAPRSLAEALPGYGTGAWALAPTIRLTVPPDAASGVYTTTLVVTIA